MKICIPVESNEGLNSRPYNHFGSAPMFLVFNTENEEISKIDNGDLNHEHGKCQPIKALSGTEVDCVIVGGIGQGAVTKLKTMGINVYRANASTVKENIDMLKENKLEEFSATHVCTSHGCKEH